LGVIPTKNMVPNIKICRQMSKGKHSTAGIFPEFIIFFSPLQADSYVAS